MGFDCDIVALPFADDQFDVFCNRAEELPVWTSLSRRRRRLLYSERRARSSFEDEFFNLRLLWEPNTTLCRPDRRPAHFKSHRRRLRRAARPRLLPSGAALAFRAPTIGRRTSAARRRLSVRTKSEAPIDKVVARRGPFFASRFAGFGEHCRCHAR